MVKQMKEQGRKALCGNVGAALGVLLFPVILIVLFSLLAVLLQMVFVLPDFVRVVTGGVKAKAVPGVLLGHAAVFIPVSVALFLLLAPIGVGCYRWFLLLARGKRLPVRQIFCRFETVACYRSTLWLVLNVELRKLAMLLLGIAPGAVVLGASFSLSAGLPRLLLLGTRLLGLFLTAYGAGVAFVYSRKYFLVYYLAARKARPCRELLHESAERMRGQRLNTAVLYLHFVPALLCCVLLLPALYVLPYLSVTLGCQANRLMNPQQEQEKS